MKSLTEHLWFEVPGRRGFINITPTIEQLVDRSGAAEGLCLVNAMHITASVFINDDESGFITITSNGWKHWRRTRRPPIIGTIAPAKTTLTLTSSARSWAGKSSSRSPRQTGFRTVGTNFLRRIRRRPSQTRAGQDNRRVTDLSSALFAQLSSINSQLPKYCSSLTCSIHSTALPFQRFLNGDMSHRVITPVKEWDTSAAQIRSVSCFNSMKRFPASSKFSN